MDWVALARTLATEAHADQVDKAGQPYIGHVARVAAAVRGDDDAEVVAWLRDYLGVTEWSDEASVRRAGSKQCSNARIKALGWAPTYPTYREGYAAILKG